MLLSSPDLAGCRSVSALLQVFCFWDLAGSLYPRIEIKEIKAKTEPCNALKAQMWHVSLLPYFADESKLMKKKTQYYNRER